MNLELVRCRCSDHGTFGKLYINDVFECYTLEPVLPVPVGSYHVSISFKSPKLRFKSPYVNYGGIVPRLLNVPGHTGILIHCGNFLKDTKGCILVGQSASLMRLFNSHKAYKQLFEKLRDANESITLKISSLKIQKK